MESGQAWNSLVCLGFPDPRAIDWCAPEPLEFPVTVGRNEIIYFEIEIVIPKFKKLETRFKIVL